MNNISIADTRAFHLEYTDVNKYRLDEINKIKQYFDNEIKERKGIIKKIKQIFS